MWRIQGRDLKPLNGAEIPSESFLEDWIARDSTILGEELLTIGRQVQVEDVKDRLDLLAIDRDLNTVIIEIKKGSVKGGVDIQCLKYASYISNWNFDQLREVAEAYFKDNKVDKTFANALQEFMEEVKDYEDVNRRQRIILVGEDFDDKILSVGRWLVNQGVSIKLVRISYLTDGTNFFLRPDAILAPAAPVLQPAAKGRPWIENGREWHLKQRCNKQAASKLEELVEFMTSLEGVDTSWNQEFYVAFILDQRNWVTVNTFPNQLNVRVRTEVGRFKVEELVKELGVSEGLVEIEERGTHDRVTIKIGPDFNIKSESFVRFIEQARESFLKSI